MKIPRFLEFRVVPAFINRRAQQPTLIRRAYNALREYVFNPIANIASTPAARYTGLSLFGTALLAGYGYGLTEMDRLDKEGYLY